jgi:hypothetical protein
LDFEFQRVGKRLWEGGWMLGGVEHKVWRPGMMCRRYSSRVKTETSQKGKKAFSGDLELGIGQKVSKKKCKGM